MKVIAAVPLLLVLLAVPAAADPMRVERTDPGHLRALNRSFLAPEVIPPRTRYVRSQAVYNLPKGLDGLTRYDAALSRLCQRGAFGQEMDGFYWARTPDKRYGVAFSGGANLSDPQNKRKTGEVYFFEGQDSRCNVHVGDQAKLMPHYVGP
ncbi:hypothetical protein GBZ26_17140 [Azospirillum formosense]|uniref:Secreted protein n=1 Tax=Azospirillum formosense TaxID=861533 RepID=A0ABX2KZ77_9PROT|nr:hypothetical protein [Azospirillum formosense]MBY3755397.1 hypothetical protein [Azospirillum formosense]NUB20913.1 hypothetical protein [Azospirillum formosense]